MNEFTFGGFSLTGMRGSESCVCACDFVGVFMCGVRCIPAGTRTLTLKHIISKDNVANLE